MFISMCWTIEKAKMDGWWIPEGFGRQAMDQRVMANVLNVTECQQLDDNVKVLGVLLRRDR